MTPDWMNADPVEGDAPDFADPFAGTEAAEPNETVKEQPVSSECETDDDAGLPWTKRAEGVAGLGGALAAGLWLSFYMSPGLAFTPWQGALLAPVPADPVPVLSRGLALAAAQLGGANALVLLNLITVVTAALLCGVTGAAAAKVLKPLCQRGERIVAGVLAAMLLAGAPLLTHVGTAASPAPVSALLGMLALTLVLLAVQTEHNMKWLAGAAVLGGLASANHPTFGLIACFILFVYLFRPVEGLALAKQLAILALLFAIGASLPLVHALAGGQSMGQFMAYALRTPYPVIASDWPQLGFGAVLSQEFPLLILLLAVPAGILLFLRHTQLPAIMTALVFLGFGPFLPFLTNRQGVDTVLQDTDAPTLIALAAVSLFAAWGVGAVMYGLRRRLGTSYPGIAVAALVLAAATAWQSAHAPTRQHDYAAELAEYIFEASPENAVLVTGGENVTSLLWAAQYGAGWRPDVDIIPMNVLTHPLQRAQLEPEHEESLDVPRPIPSEAALQRLERERPIEFQRLQERVSEGGEGEDAFADLVLWEFVRDNAHQRPLAFAAVDSAWLMARGGVQGPLLLYPRGDASSALPMDEFIDRWSSEPASLSAHAGLTETLNPLILTLSQQARRQDRQETAVRLARQASRLDPQSASARLALSRAQARRGEAGDAKAAGERYLELLDTPSAEPGIVELLDSALEQAQYEQRFKDVLQQEQNGLRDIEARRNAAEDLWRSDELTVLAEGYDELLEQDPGDIDALYHLAAAQAQLGQLEEAQEHLGEWVKLAIQRLGMSATEISEALRQDGRFVLLRLPTPTNEPVA
ncbi:MAG: tetratricopeptide repeat protein [Candidatus Hydrogenedentota bacterium]